MSKSETSSCRFGIAVRFAPLDFVAVADHSDFMDETFSLMNEGAPGCDDPVGKSFSEAPDMKTA